MPRRETCALMIKLYLPQSVLCVSHQFAVSFEAQIVVMTSACSLHGPGSSSNSYRWEQLSSRVVCWLLLASNQHPLNHVSVVCLSVCRGVSCMYCINHHHRLCDDKIALTTNEMINENFVFRALSLVALPSLLTTLSDFPFLVRSLQHLEEGPDDQTTI